MRESRDRRSRRPAVSQDRESASHTSEWRTLREASDLTGIPIGTLRKWCRRETIDSYLESDGGLTLRMVEMGSVRARSAALHGSDGEGAASHEEVASREHVAGRQTPVASQEETDPGPEPPETMIVPVDAWNKMLNQLGNLHEAGQQLAEARERAAKAETEASFLRERLAEMRETSDSSPSSDIPPPQGEVPSTARRRGSSGAATHPRPDLAERSQPEGVKEVRNAQPGKPEGLDDDQPPSEMAPFWRYVVRGWRGRRR